MKYLLIILLCLYPLIGAANEKDYSVEVSNHRCVIRNLSNKPIWVLLINDVNDRDKIQRVKFYFLRTEKGMDFSLFTVLTETNIFFSKRNNKCFYYKLIQPQKSFIIILPHFHSKRDIQRIVNQDVCILTEEEFSDIDIYESFYPWNVEHFNYPSKKLILDKPGKQIYSYDD